MTNSNKPNSGCFSGISRLLLCKRSLQTHPSDHITEFNSAEFDLYVQKDDKVVYQAKIPAAVPVGVVARLMGLDPLPVPSWLPEGEINVSNSVTRSRSVNFMDYLLQPAYLSADEQNHRVRGSVSFREVPTLLTRQKYESFVQNLDNDGEKSKRMVFSNIKSDEIKQRSSREEEEEVDLMKKERNNNMKMGNNRQFSRFVSCRGFKVEKKVQRKSGKTSISKSKSAVKPINQMEAVVESKFMKKMKNQNSTEKLQFGFSSKTSISPVSDLGPEKFSIKEQSRPLSGDDLRSKMISLPRKATPIRIWEEDSGEMEPIVIKKDEYCSFGSGDDKEYYLSLARELSKLTEKDVKESNWVAISVFDFEFFENVLYDFGQEILDVLLQQVVEELGEFCNSESFELASEQSSC